MTIATSYFYRVNQCFLTSIGHISKETLNFKATEVMDMTLFLPYQKKKYTGNVFTLTFSSYDLRLFKQIKTKMKKFS